VSELPIFYETRRVGTVEAGVEGPSFVYEPSWLATRGAFPLSILMPLSTRPVKPRVFLPWAANLLPEGTQLRTIGMMLGAAPEDVIAILTEIGRDTAGALSIGKPGSTNAGNCKPVKTEKALERILDELPAKPFLAGEDGVSMSLAGIQSKLGVVIDRHGRICIPVDGAPSTHILKPCSDRLYGSVHNEALCLRLARRCGLNAPDVTTGRAGMRTYFLIRRYDRLEQDGRCRRLHQEDFCQALGKPPSAKYEANQTSIKGPALVDMFALTRNAMRAPDVLALVDHVIFNVLCCNTDAHAKNYSLMISGRGFSLAPIYDVMCASVWESVTPNLAQKIAGKNRGDHLKRRHWETFATECGLSQIRLVARVAAIAQLVLKELPAARAEVAAMPADDHPLLAEIAAKIAARARAIVSGLEMEAKSQHAGSAATGATSPAPRVRGGRSRGVKAL
jgi:serine/threonine-protein kinase HipA